MKEPLDLSEKCLDSQLWHACAGGMVQMPPVNSKVYYFPQGHAEHVQGNVDLGACSRIPALVLCRVAAIKFMADRDTDEVFAKIQLVPLRPEEQRFEEDSELVLGNNGVDAPDKLASFAKTLTQSDANNGGGFSVPRYCAETIFPRLDYSTDPPVQTVLAKDVHGEVWKFRHIYRGTPRRHLLTTGWSTFVNQKKLVAGDSIVFLRVESGDLCIGIRRAKRGTADGHEAVMGWNHHPPRNCLAPFGGFSVFLKEDESKLMRNNNGNLAGGHLNSGGGLRSKGRMRAESVVEAANLAANGQPFEVVYYPRASTPEFCVRASSVRAAMRTQWCSGMRFKMAFETEDSSRISWFMGTILAVQVADPVRWPNSPWRLLQVSWDEPDLLQNVKRVSPWLVELVSNVPTVHLSPFSSQRKKLRLSQSSEFSLDGQLSPSMFPRNHPLGPSGSPACFLPESTPAGIQGARHAHFGISLSDLHLNKLQTGLFPTAGFHHLDRGASGSRISSSLIIGNPSIRENVSCLLSISNASHNRKKPCEVDLPKFVLFGKPILTEKEILLSNSRDGKLEKTKDQLDNSCATAVTQNGQAINLNGKVGELGLETGHCKVFMESEDIGRTLNLSVLGSYDELHRKLADMFGIEKSHLTSHVLYRDSAGAVKHTGDEPFGDFTKTAQRLTILMNSASDDVGG